MMMTMIPDGARRWKDRSPWKSKEEQNDLRAAEDPGTNKERKKLLISSVVVLDPV